MFPAISLYVFDSVSMFDVSSISPDTSKSMVHNTDSETFVRFDNIPCGESMCVISKCFTGSLKVIVTKLFVFPKTKETFDISKDTTIGTLVSIL